MVMSPITTHDYYHHYTLSVPPPGMLAPQETYHRPNPHPYCTSNSTQGHVHGRRG